MLIHQLFWCMIEKKSKFSKYHKTTKIPLFFLIQNFSSFYFFPKKWWSFGHFFFPVSEALKIFWGPKKRLKSWIFDLWACLKKLGLGAGLYGKSVLYLGSSMMVEIEWTNLQKNWVNYPLSFRRSWYCNCVLRIWRISPWEFKSICSSPLLQTTHLSLVSLWLLRFYF